MLVVKAQIKEEVKSSGHDVDNVSSDFTKALHEKVVSLVRDACRRAKENGRKTVMSKDL